MTNKNYEGLYQLSVLQELLVRKLARRYSTPDLVITVRKTGNKYLIKCAGDNRAGEILFRSALLVENICAIG